MLNIVIPHYREPRLERLEYRPWPISLSQAGRGLNPLLSLKERAVPVFLLTGGRPNTASCPAWPEETGPAGVICTVIMDGGPKQASLTDRTALVPLDLAGAAQLRYSGN